MADARSAARSIDRRARWRMACAALAEEAWRVVWTGRYGFNDQSPASNHTTSNRDDAFRFARERMELSMRQAYSRCAPPIITFVREIDRTAGSGLLYYGWPEWHIDYRDGSSCSYWNSVNTIGEIFSQDRRFETGPVDERSCTTANPVQPGSGRKRFQEADYSGAGAHPLNLQRLYSSRWMDGAAVTGLAPIATWDGGWRHSYQASLTLRADGGLRAFRPDGSMRGLSRSASVANTWTSVSSRDTVVALADAAGQRTGYTYAAATDDGTETYDAGGKLLSRRERNGWTTTLTYSDAATPLAVAPRPGLLIAVRNQFGRELKFTYDAAGRVAELLPPGAISGTPAGSAASPIRYVYDEPASLAPGVPAAGQLTSVTWQDGALKRYHYEDGRWPQAVTGITDEAGVRYGSYTYDGEGRVTRSELAGGVDRLDFAYGTDASGKPTTTVTDYSGAGGTATSRSYAFTDIGGVRFAATVSAPCSLCGNTQQSSTYNAAGDPVRTVAHDGSVTFYAYDAKGRETERATFAASYSGATTRPALVNATQVVSTQWHATFNLPAQVAEPGKTSAYAYDGNGNLVGQSWTATTDATGAQGLAAMATGSTYATGWGYNANSLNASIVTSETAQGSSTAVETGRWTYTYEASRDLKTVKNDSRQPSVTATFVAYNAHGMPTAGQLHDGRSFQIQYRPSGEVDRLTLGDGYSVQYTYSPTRQLLQAQASDNWSASVNYDSSGFANGLSTQLGAVMAAAGVGAIPEPVPLPDWNELGRVTGRLAGACLQRLGVLALILTPSTLGACDTVDNRPAQCRKPCPPCRTVSGRVVPVGTIAYRPLETPPPGTAQHGVTGPHHNLYKANQNPNNCQCFWQPQGAVSPADLPAGSIPIEPFAN